MEKGIGIMKKVLVIADIRGWAFDRIYQGLKSNQKTIEFDVHYLNEDKKQIELDKYDYIFNLPDNYIEHILRFRGIGFPQEKIIQGIRSDVKLSVYDDEANMSNLFGTLLTSNQKLYERFKDKHSDVHLWQGGVNTDFFEFKEREVPDPFFLRVGWSGSTSVFNRQFRGLDIIQDFADKFPRHLKFTPALREEKFRTIDEMKKYYTEEIDLYIEMSESAGRQNGLVEAGSCGVPVISYDCGIASELIVDGENGCLVKERNHEALREAFLKIIHSYNKYSKNIRKSIEDNWSWKKFTEDFEKIVNNK